MTTAMIMMITIASSYEFLVFYMSFVIVVVVRVLAVFFFAIFARVVSGQFFSRSLKIPYGTMAAKWLNQSIPWC